MAHPRPISPERDALFAYLIGKPYDASKLPEEIRDYEAFKKVPAGSLRKVPRVNFQMLTALDLSKEEWKNLAMNMGWQATRMNLNTMARHGVFEDEKVVRAVADRLRDPILIRNARAFPYQLLAAYTNVGEGVPMEIQLALQDAMEVATENVPRFSGKVVVAVDCSGSMSSPVTGHRKGATTTVMCNQVAALMAACILRTSEDVTVIRFDTRAEKLRLNPRDSVMTNAERIGTDGGGTDCGSPVALLNKEGARANTVIVVSDNESWFDDNRFVYGTTLANEWVKFKGRNQAAKLVCVDLAPNTTTQATSKKDVLNVGGMSDSVFDVIAAFLENSGNPDFWVSKINKTVTL